MKKTIYKIRPLATLTVCLVISLLMLRGVAFAQKDSTAIKADTTAVSEDSTEAPAKVKKIKPVKNTFESVWIIDNQTVMVPVKGTFEMDIMHRFGTVNKGYSDFWGFFAPSNMRLAADYAPIQNLYLGVGITKSNMLWDASAKYSIFTQTPKKYPVSLTFYTDMAYDTRDDEDNSMFKYATHRFSFFNQILIARKVNEKLSLQVGPNLSHQNSVNGFYTKNDSTGQDIFTEMKHDHFAVAFSGRYKLTEGTSVMLNYDQPVTKHAINNPNPNLSLGFEFTTSNHTFQLFIGNYSYLNPQRNNLFNQNSPFPYNDQTKTHANRYADNPDTTEDESTRVKGGQFVIGFNITRLWNY